MARRPKPDGANTAAVLTYLMERMDAYDLKLYTAIGLMVGLGVLHFVDPMWHWGVLQFP